MRREIVFTFNNMNEALTFMEMVTSKIKSKEILIRYDTGNGIRVWVSIQGEPHEVSLYSMEIRKIYNDIKLMRGKSGVYTYDISIILNKARLSAAIPIDLVIDILHMKGINAEMEGSKIRIVGSTTLEELVGIAEELSRVYGEMIDMEISAQAKRVIAIYSLLTGKGIKDSIKDLLEQGLLSRYGDTELLVLSMDYKHALLRLQELIE
ncbi:DUF2067 family protein [Vulcanisaeta souniana]|uniref:DUF2067 domain-containing protein n=2 Tax=Vulcanisaeta souniana TaxID=164452 RepID=A0A830DZG0_9CREN|nr:DUF2067 domain-containing protein [Vulcanisaeta souniana]BDR91616.1 hypothetical protein Vsou_07090 [Vulcanisaeta souniana JCM 11219]GGI71888.1 hypothetical protein GCM10007112_05830 [Vulcanisaeta souniana JCM 11219]